MRDSAKNANSRGLKSASARAKPLKSIPFPLFTRYLTIIFSLLTNAYALFAIFNSTPSNFLGKSLYMSSVHMYALYVSVNRIVDKALDRARTGHRNSGRRIWAELTNSRVIDILTDFDNKHGFPTEFTTDVPLLNWKLSELKIECHPQNALKKFTARDSVECAPGSSSCRAQAGMASASPFRS